MRCVSIWQTCAERIADATSEAYIENDLAVTRVASRTGTNDAHHTNSIAITFGRVKFVRIFICRMHSASVVTVALLEC